jgi:carboxypeptidase family protein
MTRLARVFSALAIFIAFSLTASAQSDKKIKKEEATLRAVQGTVVDADDKPVVGAIVQLKDVRTLQMRSYITKVDGEYHFSSLKIDDDYEVEARNNHLTSGPKKISIFDNRKIVVQNLKADKAEKLEKK